MSSSSDNDETLLFRFVSANSAIHELQSKQFDNPTERNAAQIAIIQALRKLDQDIDQSDLFSPNELFDDVQTASIKYLLTPYILAELLLNAGSGYESRAEQLKEVKILFKKFIDRLDLLMLINSTQRKLLDGAVQLNPAELRTRRIQEFKREKELMPKFLALQQKWTKLAVHEAKSQYNDDNTVGTSRNLLIDSNTTNANDLMDGQVDENERDLLVEVLSRHVDKIIQYYKQIDEEQQILEFHKKEQQNRLLAAKQPENAHNNHNNRGISTRPLHMHTISEEHENKPIPVPLLNANMTMGTGQQQTAGRGGELSRDELREIERQQLEEQQAQSRPGHVHVSKSGISSGGLRVHQFNSAEDVAKPIPNHMKEFMMKPNPAATNPQNQTSGGAGASAGGHQHGPGCNHGPGGAPGGGGGGGGHQHTANCRHAHQVPLQQQRVTKADVMTDEERLAKPWFHARVGDSCECCYEDVTALPEYVMSSKAKGRQGKLVKFCGTHKVGVDVCGCDQAKGNNDIMQKDRINEYVEMRTDRSRTFRDRNPYLMELDDFAKMKIESGELPGIKDRQLADRLKADEERHRLRIEAGDSDEDEQKLTQREIDEKEDAAQMKARNWADWADDHQKGAGNKKYRK